MTKTLRDTWLVYQRALGQTLRNPVWVFIGLANPLMFLFLFGPLLKSLPLGQSSGTSSWNVFVPGLLIQLALFGSAFVGFNLVAELRYGVIERMQVTPVSRLALLLGRAGRDITILVVQAAMIMLIAWPLGLDVDAAGVGVTLVLLILIGLAFVSFSYTIALILRSEDALAPLLNALSIPLLLLSGILLPMSLAPAWLRDVAKANPLSHAVDAVRQVFTGTVWDGTVARGVAVMGALAVVLVAVAVRRFQRAAA
jgi:ABC-2 type transport system permease protein